MFSWTCLGFKTCAADYKKSTRAEEEHGSASLVYYEMSCYQAASGEREKVVLFGNLNPLSLELWTVRQKKKQAGNNKEQWKKPDLTNQVDNKMSVTENPTTNASITTINPICRNRQGPYAYEILESKWTFPSYRM